MPAASSFAGVPEISRGGGRATAGGTGDPSGDGQLRNPQNSQGEALVRAPSPLPLALHPDERELAESSRALLRRDYPAPHPARHLHSRAGVGRSHPGVLTAPQSEPETVRVDRDGGCDLEKGSALL